MTITWHNPSPEEWIERFAELADTVLPKAKITTTRASGSSLVEIFVTVDDLGRATITVDTTNESAEDCVSALLDSVRQRRQATKPMRNRIPGL